MKENRNIHKLFLNYKINKVKIENKIISNIDVNGNCNLKIEEIWEEKKYIDTIENILQNLSKQDSDLLISFYVENKFWGELSYSYSSFYKKLKRAESLFLSFLK